MIKAAALRASPHVLGGMARYVILYEGDEPKEIYFAGYSFD